MLGRPCISSTPPSRSLYTARLSSQSGSFCRSIPDDPKSYDDCMIIVARSTETRDAATRVTATVTSHAAGEVKTPTSVATSPTQLQYVPPPPWWLTHRSPLMPFTPRHITQSNVLERYDGTVVATKIPKYHGNNNDCNKEFAKKSEENEKGSFAKKFESKGTDDETNSCDEPKEKKQKRVRYTVKYKVELVRSYLKEKEKHKTFLHFLKEYNRGKGASDRVPDWALSRWLGNDEIVQAAMNENQDVNMYDSKYKTQNPYPIEATVTYLKSDEGRRLRLEWAFHERVKWVRKWQTHLTENVHNNKKKAMARFLWTESKGTVGLADLETWLKSRQIMEAAASNQPISNFEGMKQDRNESDKRRSNFTYRFKVGCVRQFLNMKKEYESRQKFLSRQNFIREVNAGIIEDDKKVGYLQFTQWCKTEAILAAAERNEALDDEDPLMQEEQGSDDQEKDESTLLIERPYYDVEVALEAFIEEHVVGKKSLTIRDIQMEADRIADAVLDPNHKFLCSDEWIHNFLERHEIWDLDQHFHPTVVPNTTMKKALCDIHYWAKGKGNFELLTLVKTLRTEIQKEEAKAQFVRKRKAAEMNTDCDGNSESDQSTEEDSD